MRFSSPFRPATRLETATQTHTLPGEADRGDGANESDAPILSVRQDAEIARLIGLELDELLFDITFCNGLGMVMIGMALICFTIDQAIGYVGSIFFCLLALFMFLEASGAKENIRHRDKCSRIRANTANREAADLESEMHNRYAEHARLYRLCLQQQEIIAALTEGDDMPSAEVIFLDRTRH